MGCMRHYVIILNKWHKISRSAGHKVGSQEQKKIEQRRVMFIGVYIRKERNFKRHPRKLSFHSHQSDKLTKLETGHVLIYKIPGNYVHFISAHDDVRLKI